MAADPVSARIAGGEITLFGLSKGRGAVRSAPATAEYFVAKWTGWPLPPQVSRLPDGNPGDTLLVDRTVWSRGGASIVAFYIIDSGGHVVPQRVYRWPRFLGRTTKQFNAPMPIWDSFARGEPNKTVGIARSRVPEVRESAQHYPLVRAVEASHKSMIAPHKFVGQCVSMADYRNEEAARRIIRCATCDGMVFAELVGFGRADANSVCTFCGMTKTDLPFAGGDYFDVLMRSRSTGHVRLRGAQ